MELEKLAEEVHQIYCKQYKEKNGEEYWTKGDYSLLDEPTKEQDRVIVRWHLEKIKRLITLYNKALESTELPVETWKKIGSINGIFLD